jgi:hypothetical protein
MAIELGEQLDGNSNFGECCGLLERICGVASGVGSPQAAVFGEHLVRTSYGRDVEVAFTGDVADG